MKIIDEARKSARVSYGKNLWRPQNMSPFSVRVDATVAERELPHYDREYQVTVEFRVSGRVSDEILQYGPDKLEFEEQQLERLSMGMQAHLYGEIVDELRSVASELYTKYGATPEYRTLKKLINEYAP